jgi:hypothetical protein
LGTRFCLDRRELIIVDLEALGMRSPTPSQAKSIKKSEERRRCGVFIDAGEFTDYKNETADRQRNFKVRFPHHRY